MNEMDRDQIIVNKVNIDRLLKDVEDLQDMLQVHVDGDASDHFAVNSKLAQLAYDLANLKEQLQYHSKSLESVKSGLDNLHNFKLTLVAWLGGAGGVIWLIWTVISKYIN